MASDSGAPAPHRLTALFLNRHGDTSFFGKWIFNQAAEAKGAVEIAEQAEGAAKSRRKMRENRGRGKLHRRTRPR